MSVSIGGVGCSLMDYLFAGVDFGGVSFARHRSRTRGDGGLEPGALVLVEALERFCGRPYREVLAAITGDVRPTSRNLGGPSVVALVHAAQLLEGSGVTVSFYGLRGDDRAGGDITDVLAHTPLVWDHYAVVQGTTPFTHVLSDPAWADGAGERCFVNSTGVAAQFRAAWIDPSLYEHAIVAFGGTALVPQLHAELHLPLRRARAAGALTVVNTVFDFVNEARAPRSPWPIGDSRVSYANTDLLVVDAEEAYRLSGASRPEAAAAWFARAGAGAIVITCGAEPLLAVAGGARFRPLEPQRFPVSARIAAELRGADSPPGDTTGCGDNFVGGMLYALAMQLDAGERALDLRHALAWAVASGGYACFFLGGTTIEPHPGRKRATIAAYVRDYQRQLDSRRDR